MANKRIIEYKDIMDLGFIREEPGDKVFFNEYGFEWMIVSLILWENKKEMIKAHWSCTERTVEIHRFKKKGGDNLDEFSIMSLEELKTVIKAYSLL